MGGQLLRNRGMTFWGTVVRNRGMTTSEKEDGGTRERNIVLT